MVHYKLTYFNIRGRAEVIRLIFAAAGVDFEDVRVESVDHEQWAALKPSTPFGQLPILEFEGKTFCQSHSIARYLARKFDLAGKTELEQLHVDMIVACMEDAILPFFLEYGEKDEARKAPMKKKFSEEQLPAAYASLEKLLKSNKGGDAFFVGDGITWADLSFHTFVLWAELSGNKELLDKYPKLKALEKRVESLPKVAAWIAKRPVTTL